MNTKFAAVLAGLAMAATMSFTGGAAAYAPHTNVSTLGLANHYAAVTPLAMQYFCAQHANQCASGGRSQVTMTPNVMAVLKQVNSRVNGSIRPRAERADVWSLNPTSGDCEDYVLSKRAALISKGLPAGALRIAYTHTRRGEPHAVLVVKTSQGDLVLDNLSGSVKTLRSSGYHINTMSSPNPTRWIAG